MGAGLPGAEATAGVATGDGGTGVRAGTIGRTCGLGFEEQPAKDATATTDKICLRKEIFE